MAREDAIVVDQVNDVRVVHLLGEHDIETMTTVEPLLAAAVSSGCPIVVDLTDCTFIDSTSLSVLFSASKAAGEGRFVVAATPGSDAARMLDLVAFSSIVPVYESAERAIEAVSAEK